MAEPAVTPAAPTPNLAPAVPVHVPNAAPGTVQSNPDITPWQERWQADQDAITRERPWSDPNMLLQKDPRTGVITARPRDRSASDAPPGTGNQPQQPQRPVGPATSDGTKLRIGELELSEADVRGLMERKGIEDSRKATMPASAQAYELKLPENFELPPGVAEFKWNLDDPLSSALLGSAKQFAFENGLDQGGFSRMMALYASHQLSEQARFAQVQRQQLEQLGPNAAGRVDAVATWLQAMAGPKAESLRRSMFLADQVTAFETLMRNFVGQGVHGNVGAARDGGPETPGKLSDEDYGRLSYHEKLVYAENFNNNRGGR
jgi:hypothetical protein